MLEGQAAARFKPDRSVIAALRDVRRLGLARRLGVIDPDLMALFRRASDDLLADHSYIEDTAVHWGRAGLHLDAADKDTAYTRSLRTNVEIGKITDEAGALAERYRGTPFEPALAEWLGHVRRYADNPTLTRMNVSHAGARVAEHVDPPDQNMIQCLIEGETTFEFRTRQGRQIFEMQAGDVWWFNTTWPHRTRISGQGRRLLLHTRATLRPEFLARCETPPARLIGLDDPSGGDGS